MGRKKKHKENLISYQATITYRRNPDYFLLTDESQKIGNDLVWNFPFRKKDIFLEAERILADRYYDGNLERCRAAMTIISLTKHTYPTQVIYRT